MLVLDHRVNQLQLPDKSDGISTNVHETL